MKIRTAFNNLNSVTGTVIFIIFACLGILTWSAGMFIALLILLCAAFLPLAIDFLIINPFTKIIQITRTKTEA